MCYDDGGRSDKVSAADTLSESHLTSYINLFTKVPLLTATEERRLARKSRDGDRAAFEKLIKHNMRMVVSLARKFIDMPLEDCVQEGALGLMTAVERFNPELGYRLSTYATPWINQAIGRARDNKKSSIRLPAHISETLRKVQRVRGELESAGQAVTTEILCRECGLTEAQLTKLMDNVAPDTLSLDYGIGDDGRTPMGAMISSDETKSYAASEFDIEPILDKLDDKERLIIEQRVQDERKVLSEAGEEFDLSRARCRGIEIKAIRKLRAAAKTQRLKEMGILN